MRNIHHVGQTFRDYRPDLVHHAAAHKYVLLVEKSPNEAIKNNVCGKLNVAWAADMYGSGYKSDENIEFVYRCVI